MDAPGARRGRVDEASEDALWSFALSFYADPRIAAACLALQDEAGVDVDILLLAIFALLDRGIVLGDDDLAAVEAIAHSWRVGVVQPLRDLRKRLKSETTPALVTRTVELREQVKASELLAERIELSMLGRWLEQQQSHPREAPSQGVPLRVARFFAARAQLQLNEKAISEPIHALDLAILERTALRTSSR